MLRFDYTIDTDTSSGKIEMALAVIGTLNHVAFTGITLFVLFAHAQDKPWRDTALDALLASFLFGGALMALCALVRLISAAPAFLRRRAARRAARQAARKTSAG